VGTQTETGAAWTGNVSFSSLTDGQQITYWLPYGGASNVTLELTFPDGTTTGAIPCYYSQGTRLSTQYVGGNIVHFTYRKNATYFTTTIAEGWWADANYNSDTYDRIRYGSIRAKETCAHFRYIVGDDNGFFQLAAGVPFNVSKPILWLTSPITAGYTTSNVYLAYSSLYVRYHLNDFTGVQSASLYLVGTLEGTTFTPAEDYLTCTVPTAEDGLTYMLLGTMTSAYYSSLFPEHPMYRFVDGAFKPLSQVAYEAFSQVGTLRVETQTAIEQTNAAIALKADQTAVDSLSERMDSAELKLQPDQLMSRIRSSALYRYDQYGGRNYALDSHVEVKFVGGYYTYASGTTTSYTGVQIYTSDDLFAHSGGCQTLRMSFDIKRTNVEAASASTAGVYSGVWIYYQYLDDSGNTKVTGRGYYLRTTDSDFAATDDDWVRITKGPMNISSYSPIGIAYFSFGTANAVGSTGTVQFRNVKVEVSDSFTDWSAAPEDLNDVNQRLTTAESTISQQANQIALKVSTSTYNTEKVYRSTTAPTTLYTNMLWLDLSLSPPILKRYTGSTWIAVGAQEVKNSGITIGSNNVSITTENFLLQLLDPSNNENVLMEMSADGNVGFKELYADEVISDSVAKAYFGPSDIYISPSYSGTSDTYFRSLGDAMNALKNRFLDKDVFVYLPYGTATYEPAGVLIQGITGPGRLIIYGYSSNSILNSFVKVKGCSAHIYFQNVHLREVRGLNGSSYQSYLVEILMSHYVEFYGCTLDANSVTYDSVYSKGSYVYMNTCGLYNALQGLELFTGQAFLLNCKGSCNWSMISYAGIIIAAGTVPAGSMGSGNNGQVFASNTTVDYGTAIPTVTPDETGIMYASTTKSWRGSWRTDTLDVIQGVYNDAGFSSSLSWHRGCMWFSTARNLLSGCTVKSATLTLHRKTGSGSSSAKTVYLCAISNTLASGTPSIAANFGALGTIGRGSQVTFSIPVAAVQGLADGTYGGLCLYESPYDFGSSTYSNCYMRMSGTDTNYEPYIQCVFSGSTAVG